MIEGHQRQANERLEEAPNSKRILERLRQGANKQRKDSLARLEATCDALDRSAGELTFANIGRRCFQDFKKGPIESSIKNDAGFKEYVQARRDERVLALTDGKSGRRKAKTPLANLIEHIADQGLRARMRMLYGESLELRRKLFDVQQALFVITPGVDVDTIIRRLKANPGAPVSAVPSRNAAVQPEDLEGLRALLAVLDMPETLGRFGLENDGKRVRRAKGVKDELISARVLGALRRLHGALADRHGSPTEVDGEVVDAE